MKMSVTIPDSLFRAAEREARRQSVSRSRFYARAVEFYLKQQRDKSIKEALDTVYATEDSSLDPWLAAAAYEVFSKEKW